MDSFDRCGADARSVRPGRCGDHSNHDGESRDLAGGDFGKGRRHHRVDQQGMLAHTATARNGDFDVTMPPNKTMTLVLKKAGTVDYYCRFHPNMKATLVVEPIPRETP